MSCTDPTAVAIPEAEALRPQWDDLAGRIAPHADALRDLLGAVHTLERHTSDLAIAWAESRRGDLDDLVDTFVERSGCAAVDRTLVSLAALI